jgi:hypothetical protein
VSTHQQQPLSRGNGASTGLVVLAVVVALILGIALAFAWNNLTDDSENVAATSPAGSAETTQSVGGPAQGSEKALVSNKTDVRTLAPSAVSQDEDHRLWIIVDDRTGNKVPARVTFSRQTAPGTWSVMTGSVGSNGLVKLEQHDQDLVEGNYLLVVSKSLGKGYTRDFHYQVEVKGGATTARVTYTKLKVKQKTRIVIRCEVSRKAPKARGGGIVTYRPPSAAPSRPSYTQPKRVSRTRVSGGGKPVAIARASATGGQAAAQAASNSAKITQTQSGQCGNNCAVSNNANGNINQQNQQQQTQVNTGGGGSTNTGSSSARASVSTGDGKSDCVQATAGNATAPCP